MGDFGFARGNLSYDQAFAALRAGARVRRAVWTKCITWSGINAVWDYGDEEWASLGVGMDRTYFPNDCDTNATDWIVVDDLNPRSKQEAA